MSWTQGVVSPAASTAGSSSTPSSSSYRSNLILTATNFNMTSYGAKDTNNMNKTQPASLFRHEGDTNRNDQYADTQEGKLSYGGILLFKHHKKSDSNQDWGDVPSQEERQESCTTNILLHAADQIQSPPNKNSSSSNCSSILGVDDDHDGGDDVIGILPPNMDCTTNHNNNNNTMMIDRFHEEALQNEKLWDEEIWDGMIDACTKGDEDDVASFQLEPMIVRDTNYQMDVEQTRRNVTNTKRPRQNDPMIVSPIADRKSTIVVMPSPKNCDPIAALMGLSLISNTNNSNDVISGTGSTATTNHSNCSKKKRKADPMDIKMNTTRKNGTRSTGSLRVGYDDDSTITVVGPNSPQMKVIYEMMNHVERMNPSTQGERHQQQLQLGFVLEHQFHKVIRECEVRHELGECKYRHLPGAIFEKLVDTIGGYTFMKIYQACRSCCNLDHLFQEPSSVSSPSSLPQPRPSSPPSLTLLPSLTSQPSHPLDSTSPFHEEVVGNDSLMLQLDPWLVAVAYGIHLANQHHMTYSEGCDCVVDPSSERFLQLVQEGANAALGMSKKERLLFWLQLTTTASSSSRQDDKKEVVEVVYPSSTSTPVVLSPMYSSSPTPAPPSMPMW